MNLLDALKQLDPENTNQWTADGLPRMDAIVDLTGDESVSRKAVTDAAPNLTRDTAAGFDWPQASADTPTKTEDDVPEAPAQAPQEAAVPEPSESVLSMPIQDVLGHPDLTDRAIEEINVKVSEVLQGKAAIEEQLKQLYAKSEMLSRVKVQHDRTARRNGTKRTNVQDYLAAQAKSRHERALRAQRFIDAGTTAHDVAAQLGSKSKIDAAMSQRKPSPGSQRPAARPPAHV